MRWMRSPNDTAAARSVAEPILFTVLALSLALAAPAAAAKKPAKTAEPAATPVTATKSTTDGAKTDAPATVDVATTPHQPGEAVAGLPEWKEPEHYSVDMVCNGGDQKMVLRRYIDGGRIRTDIDSEGQKVSMIELGDADGTMLMIMPEEKQVMKSSRKAMLEAAPPEARKQLEKQTPEKGSAPPPAGKMVYLGREKVDGKDADKYRYDGGEQSAVAWIDPATRYPVKMQSGDAVVEYQNYSVGPQPAKLFEAPKDYTVTDMDEMMKSMKAQAGSSGMAGLSGLMGGAGVPGMAGGVSGMANQMAGNYGAQMGAGFGGSLGASLGAALGGPIGAMAGQYLGGKLGAFVGSKAAKAVVPGK